MKHYIYISDAKIKMMFPQIPFSFWHKLRMSVELKFRGVSLKVEGSSDDPTRIYRLRKISSYLKSKDLIGTLMSDRPYFYTKMKTMTLVADEGIVLWMGYYRDSIPPVREKSTVVCFGGSTSHIIGVSDDGNHDSIPIESKWPNLLALGSYDQSIRHYISRPLNKSGLFGAWNKKKSAVDPEDDVSHANVRQTLSFMLTEDEFRVTITQGEFLARRLSDGMSSSGRTIIATPLYVANDVGVVDYNDLWARDAVP